MIISLNKNYLEIAILKHIDELIDRQNNKNRFTKFDSDNDTFLGYLGEVAFEIFLQQKGFNKNSDFVRLDECKLNPAFKKYFTFNSTGTYDSCDFLLKLFFDKDGKNLPLLKIDVKTQKYVGQYTADWQFSVNSNTISKIQKNIERIDLFVFIFSKIGIDDCFDFKLNKLNVEQLNNLKNDYQSYIKINSIDLDILGSMSPKNLINLAVPFEKDEIFRINNLKPYITHSPMHRITIKYLENINKIIPSRTIDYSQKNVNLYKNNFPDEKKFIKIINYDNNYDFLPYNKVYLNSQFKDFQEFIHKINNLNTNRNVNAKYKQ